jgi:Ni,Fe-hydrogenase III small subunit/NAD-dependent dihydropyrimidine dehydrogenase PreA subunit
MTKWVWKGLQAGIKTTSYPPALETAPGISPGRPRGRIREDEDLTRSLVEICPTGALKEADKRISVDYDRCIHCFRCKRQIPTPMFWEDDFEWAEAINKSEALQSPFSRSLHIRIVDAGACGACLSEIKQLNNPYYNIHRLGFFITPTPRTADVLLVVGPGTDHMRLPLEKAFEAMPAPKRVVAVGTCALTGGVFGPSFTTRAGVGEMVPVDVEVPGCPPPPLAILHALLVTAGRREPRGVSSLAEAEKKGERS